MIKSYMKKSYSNQNKKQDRATFMALWADAVTVPKPLCVSKLPMQATTHRGSTRGVGLKHPVGRKPRKPCLYPSAGSVFSLLVHLPLLSCAFFTPWVQKFRIKKQYDLAWVQLFVYSCQLCAPTEKQPNATWGRPLWTFWSRYFCANILGYQVSKVFACDYVGEWFGFYFVFHNAATTTNEKKREE